MVNNLLHFYLQIDGLGNQTVLAEPPYRTQEVGGSNPPSSIDEEGLQTRSFAFRRAVQTAPPLTPLMATSG
jgi:hypothetical protein